MATHFFISLKKSPLNLRAPLRWPFWACVSGTGGVSQCDTANRFRVASGSAVSVWSARSVGPSPTPFPWAATHENVACVRGAQRGEAGCDAGTCPPSPSPSCAW